VEVLINESEAIVEFSHVVWLFVINRDKNGAKKAAALNGKISTSTEAEATLTIERCRPEAAFWSFENKVEPCKIFVGHIPASVKKAVLRAAFSKYGRIKDIRVAGKVKEVYNAYIEFEEEASAKGSIDGMDGSLLWGGKISVAISDPSSKVIPYVLRG
jgi:RNA recognition motif-containing protein